ncbi:NodT family efflux transporter outer membrane factor (OMF) lipoprotein [Azospirillum fermentarium]|uniref:efflux transporter outer membrane subunit n=1 Tax=Azospirillum fermentarium TaxID=1233114 RepID=UPI0022264A7A|nr:efflux transporter outer membrane subunit [Azospirillum fermentarium]MCW2244677.1 NodT family efflux transporter outer membrane factor (OMF) lipoprotein [Azospirillum fermentarium]
MTHRLLLLTLPLLGGCALLAEPHPAPPPVPAAWDTAAPDKAAPVWPDARWWQGFGSAELDRLEAQAESANTDLAAAFARIRQAEAQAKVAGAALLPSLGAGGSGDRSISRNTSSGTSGSGLSSAGSRGTRTSTSFSGNLQASYEIDLFGGNAAAAESAGLSLMGTRYEREATALTVRANVAAAYLQILSLRDRVRLAQETLKIAEEVLEVLTLQVQAGAASDLELAQQRAAVAQQRASLTVQQQNERQARDALAVLLGRAPQGFVVDGKSLSALTLPAITPGLPATLLERRPDLRRADATLRAAGLDIVTARANRLPSLSLTARGSVQAATMAALFDGPGTVTALAGSLTAPLFEGNRLEGQQEQATARRDEAIETYRAAVLAALRDVEDALSAAVSAEQQYAFAREAYEQAQTALRIVEARFRAGTVGFLTVLDTQRTVFQTNDSLVQADLARFNARVSLYKALGGGWDGTTKSGP